MFEPLVLDPPSNAKNLGKDLFYINLYANLEFLKDYAHRNGSSVSIPDNELPEAHRTLVNAVCEMASAYMLDKDLHALCGQGINPDSPFMHRFMSSLEDLDMLNVGKNLGMMLRGEQYRLDLPPFDNDFFVRETICGTGYRWGPFALVLNDVSERLKQLYMVNVNQNELIYTVDFPVSYHPVSTGNIISHLHIAPPEPFETAEGRALGAMVHLSVAEVLKNDEQEYINTIHEGFGRRAEIHEASKPFREAMRGVAQQMVEDMKAEGGVFEGVEGEEDHEQQFSCSISYAPLDDDSEEE